LVNLYRAIKLLESFYLRVTSCRYAYSPHIEHNTIKDARGIAIVKGKGRTFYQLVKEISLSKAIES
jgi:hypothetical protein